MTELGQDDVTVCTLVDEVLFEHYSPTKDDRNLRKWREKKTLKVFLSNYLNFQINTNTTQIIQGGTKSG